jgi:hypothetical protein
MLVSECQRMQSAFFNYLLHCIKLTLRICSLLCSLYCYVMTNVLRRVLEEPDDVSEPSDEPIAMQWSQSLDAIDTLDVSELFIEQPDFELDLVGKD